MYVQLPPDDWRSYGKLVDVRSGMARDHQTTSLCLDQGIVDPDI